ARPPRGGRERILVPARPRRGRRARRHLHLPPRPDPLESALLALRGVRGVGAHLPDAARAARGRRRMTGPTDAVVLPSRWWGTLGIGAGKEVTHGGRGGRAGGSRRSGPQVQRDLTLQGVHGPGGGGPDPRSG